LDMSQWIVLISIGSKWKFPDLSTEAIDLRTGLAEKLPQFEEIFSRLDSLDRVRSEATKAGQQPLAGLLQSYADAGIILPEELLTRDSMERMESFASESGIPMEVVLDKELQLFFEAKITN